MQPQATGIIPSPKVGMALTYTYPTLPSNQKHPMQPYYKGYIKYNHQLGCTSYVQNQ
jgi:hypothetical protein